MEIIFVRHGQPAWSEGGTAVHDPGLTGLGSSQAEASAGFLAGSKEINEIITSPAHRARETARPLARLLDSDPTEVGDLTELRMPDWTGKPTQEVERIFRDAHMRPADEWWDGFPGGESFREFHARVTSAIDEVLDGRGVHPLSTDHLWHDDGEVERIVLFGHGGTNAVAIGHLLGLDPTPWEWERFRLAHCSISRVRTVPLAGHHVMSLTEANSVAHLGELEVTR